MTGSIDHSLEIRRIVALAEKVSGSRKKALAWINRPIAEFDNQTPAELVANGRADVVFAYIESLSSGATG